MKAQLAFALLVVLISSISLKQAHHCERDSGNDDSAHPKLTNHWVLQFDHASRNGVKQASNSFSVSFNGEKLQEWNPTDYQIHHEKLTLHTQEGKNSFHLIGTGVSDGLGQGVDNIAITRKSFCGFENAVINGGFEEGHNLGHGWSIFANGKIPGWQTTDNQLEVGWGKIYNGRWPDTHICELDGNHNTDAFQEFNLDAWNRITDFE